MTFGNQCRVVLKITLPIQKPMVINLSIQPFMVPKAQWNSKLEHEKCTKSLNLGLPLTGLTNKGLKQKLMFMKFLKPWIGFMNLWNCVKKLVIQQKILSKPFKKIFYQIRFMSSLQMVKSKNYQEVQVLLTLLMLSIQKLVTMRLERK